MNNKKNHWNSSDRNGELKTKVTDVVMIQLSFIEKHRDLRDFELWMWREWYDYVPCGYPHSQTKLLCHFKTLHTQRKIKWI